ncbi:unnamed protein product [Boreogadus saida]
MQKLLDQSIVHHVCDEPRKFKDLKLFYRFRKDDGTFPLDHEAKVFMRGQRIYEKLMNMENNLLQTREEEDGAYEETLVASEFIDWLLQEGEIATRQEAEQLGRRLLEHGIIQHDGWRRPKRAFLCDESGTKESALPSLFAIVLGQCRLTEHPVPSRLPKPQRRVLSAARTILETCGLQSKHVA